jgi:hypothetical protein
MQPNETKVQVQVEDDRIIVTIPGSSFRVAYARSPDAPKITQSRMMATDHEAAVSQREFEMLAGEVANAKARELGWIV